MTDAAVIECFENILNSSFTMIHMRRKGEYYEKWEDIIYPKLFQRHHSIHFV